MKEQLNRLDREQMIFQLMVYTLYTEQVLKGLSDEKLIELYKAKVDNN